MLSPQEDYEDLFQDGVKVRINLQPSRRRKHSIGGKAPFEGQGERHDWNEGQVQGYGD